MGTLTKPQLENSNQLAMKAVVRICGWCEKELAPSMRKDAQFCGKKCRNYAWRLRREKRTAEKKSGPMRFRYDDPPFVGTAQKYYSSGEVNYPALIAEALAEKWDGYALSASSKSLRKLLPLFPDDVDVRICAWVMPHNPSPDTKGIQSCWQALLVVGGRQVKPGRRDWLQAHAARLGGTLPGRKPIKFVRWLYELWGFQAGDTLLDKFPGTGVVTRGFRILSTGRPAEAARWKAGLEPEAAPVCGVCSNNPMKCVGQEGCELLEHMEAVNAG